MSYYSFWTNEETVWLYPSQKRQKDSAQDISGGDDQDAQDRPCIPCFSHPEIEHVCYAVLCSAQDKHHDAEEQGQVFSQLVGVVFIALHGDIDQDVAQNAQKGDGD